MTPRATLAVAITLLLAGCDNRGEQYKAQIADLQSRLERETARANRAEGRLAVAAAQADQYREREAAALERQADASEDAAGAAQDAASAAQDQALTADLNRIDGK